MPSQPDNLDAETFSNHPVSPEGTGPAPMGGPVLPSRSVEVGRSDALENSTPLEVRRVRYVISPNRAVPAPQERSPIPAQPIAEPVFPTELLRSEPVTASPIQTSAIDAQMQDIVVPLLDERVVVDRHRRKVGEVVVRKEVETRIVEVPIYREKLIVEQVSPQYEQLAVVELGEAQLRESISSAVGKASQPPSVSGRFASTAQAMQFLAAIAAEPNADPHDVQIEIVLENAAQQALYQRLLAQYSAQIGR